MDDLNSVVSVMLRSERPYTPRREVDNKLVDIVSRVIYIDRIIGVAKTAYWV
jgi:hypothetical protein